MKKTLAISAALLLAASLSACSGDTSNQGDGSAPATQESGTSAAPGTSEESGSSVVYEVTGDGATAGNITYMTLTGGNMGTEQANAAPLPFTKEVPLEDAGMFEASSFTLTAQADDSGTTISCKITVDGEVKAEQTSTGPYAVVSCSGF